MYYVVTGKVVTDEKLFAPGGAFADWAKAIEYSLYEHGVNEAPLNKRPNKSLGQPPVGALKASISAELQHVTLRRFNIELSADTDYATYVHEGTSTIYARNSGGRFAGADIRGGLYLPANPGYGAARWRQRVRGQAANPFLRRAWNETARFNSAMGKFALY